jgi:hypothetical protein
MWNSDLSHREGLAADRMGNPWEVLGRVTSDSMADSMAQSPWATMADAGCDLDASVAEGPRAYQMRCECLQERTVFDLLDHVHRLRQEQMNLDSNVDPRLAISGGPILIYVTDYHEAVEIDRCLSAVKLRTQLASPFTDWVPVLGRLGTGQLDVIISTTTEIPHAEQIAWGAIYLPTALHLAMLTTPALDWLGNYWFANHCHQTPPRLVVRRTV